jgi:hypothetical protein
VVAILEGEEFFNHIEHGRWRKVSTASGQVNPPQRADNFERFQGGTIQPSRNPLICHS